MSLSSSSSNNNTSSSQRIPDGYATIRRSGLLRHPSLKRASVPKTRSTSDLSVVTPPPSSSNGLAMHNNNNNTILTQLDSISTENNNIKYSSRASLASSSSPKKLNDDEIDEFANLNETNDSISGYNYSLPPLKSPQYINRLNTFRSKTKDINLYTRPRSPTESFTSLPCEPLYQNVPQSPIYANFNSFRVPLPPPPPPRDYQSLAKLKTFHSLYDESVTKRKPPIKSATLQSRTFHSSNTSNNISANNEIIYAEPMLVPLANSTNIGSSEFSDISSDGYSSRIGRRSASDIVSLDFGPSNKPSMNRYATFGYQKKNDGEKHLTAGKSTGSLNEAQLDYFDIMSCKIGCQNTVRTKPKVPWYELAIKKDNRQSCPPLYETEAHVVSAFEQSLSNMTTRLQQLTATTEKKDSEILEMRQTIELLRKQSIQAGLTTAHMQSMGVKNQNNVAANSQQQQNTPQTQQQQANNAQMKNTNSTEHVGRLPSSESTLQRHLSSDSMCSLNSISSGCSNDKKKKKGWLRSSFSKAFSRNAKITKVDRSNRQMSSHSNLGSNTDVSSQHSHVMSPELPPKMPTMENNHVEPQKPVTIIDNANPIDALDLEGNPVVEDLKKQLREKDMVLTDIRLEALSSASQLENLKETVMKMRQEMINLKQNNERLQRLITSRSLAGSDASLGIPASPSTTDGGDRRFSLATDKSGSNVQPVNTSEIEQMLDSQLNEMLSILQPLPTTKDDDALQSPVKFTKLSTSTIPETEILSAGMDEIPDGKKIAISVFLGQPECFDKYADELSNDVSSSEKDLVTDASEFVISYTYISGKTTWQNLDYVVRRTFKEYLAKVDPGSNLGLNTDSISSYYLGEAKRGPEMGLPELLPCGYIVGHTNTLYICLQGVSSLAFDSLVPRGIVNRYVNLLIEHRRLILCGPSGTGKSYLARKLAEFLIEKSDSDVIATFNVDNKSNKELQQYLGHISEQAMNGENELPSVIILENLHTANELGDVFSSLLNAGPKLPFLIATMSQSTCNATNLQLHHNFRWILLANHMDPVKGLLARYLRRKLYLLELVRGKSNPQLEAQLLWLPLVWQHINSVLETHCSSDVTIGPRLFLDVPLDSAESEQFFINLWNLKLVPYIVEVVREGIQLYGRRGTWTDPCTFIRESWPWPVRPTSVPKLKQITVEEIGLEGMVSGNNDNDPLLEMLMRLQEAANCNGNKDDSDCESNMTHDSSAGIE
ncbi:protein sickie isoform X1 [Culicoides brevitarsis]|uniref:protein sickie isoform X1 n=1 Tax=Culicoides brevitarsis TaxID=469753 RepID=UPI00307C2E2B